MTWLAALWLTTLFAAEPCRVLYVTKAETPRFEVSLVREALRRADPACVIAQRRVDHLTDVAPDKSVYDLIVAHDFGFGDLGLGGDVPAGLSGRLTREGRMILLPSEPVNFEAGAAWRAQAARVLTNLGADHGSLFVPTGGVSLRPERYYHLQVGFGDTLLYGSMTAVALAGTMVQTSTLLEYRALLYTAGSFALMKLAEFAVGDALGRPQWRHDRGDSFVGTFLQSFMFGVLAAALQQATPAQIATALGGGVLIGSLNHLWQTVEATRKARAFVDGETRARRLNKGHLARAFGRREVTSNEDDFPRVLRCESALGAG